MSLETVIQGIVVLLTILSGPLVIALLAVRKGNL